MTMKDLFGSEVADTPKRRHTTGHAAKPGTGPAGEMCGTCRHDRRVSGGNRNFHKCALLEHAWSHGLGTDIKKRDPACRLWEKREAAEETETIKERTDESSKTGQTDEPD